MKLESQFRCNGSDGYLAWVDQLLEIRETANRTPGFDYDFRVFDDPNELRKAIRERNASNKARMAEVHPDDIIILDANLSEETLRHIAAHAPCRIAADPVSANKASRILPVLDRLTIFKPNQYEAQELTGIWIRDDETARQSLSWFRAHGVKETIISMIRKTGVYYYCNLASPSLYDGEAIKNIDYDLDVKLYPDRSYQILDENEYAAHGALQIGRAHV